MRRSSIFALFALAGLGCGGGAADTVTPEIVATIHVTSESPTINVRQERTLAIEFRDATGRMLVGVTGVNWSSSDPATIGVNGSGVVQGVKAGGPVTITAAQGGVTGSVALTVVPGLRLQPTASLLDVGATVTLAVNTVDYFGATLGTVTATGWSSNNTNVATVDGSGVVTGVSAGEATITAQAAGATQSAQVEVGVATPFDGTWTGTPAGNGVSTLTVKYGAVRSLDLALIQSFIVNGTLTPCTAHVVASGRYPTVSNAFSFPSPYGTATFTGQFTDANNGSITYPVLGVPPSLFPCAPTNTNVQVAVPGRTFTLTK